MESWHSLCRCLDVLCFVRDTDLAVVERSGTQVSIMAVRGNSVSAQVVPLFPRSTICRGTDLVKYAVTKGALMNELTKSEKRKCRELIQLGLNRECAKFVEQIRNLSQTTSEDPHAQYIAIYRKTRTFDKHVAWRYDDMRGSKYLPTVASLLADKVIREDEIVGFSDENREHISRSASIRYA